MRYSFLTFITFLLILASCSGTKNLIRPNIEMPASFLTGTDSLPAKDTLSIAYLDWWEFYSDTILTSILKTALDNNLDLLKATARMKEMSEMYGVAKADLLPQVGINLVYSNETSKYNGGELSKDPEFDLKMPISWEVNLWGSLFHAKDASKARFVASVEDYRAMRMSLVAQIATLYFQLMTLKGELAIVQQTLRTREEALHQAKLRFEGGLTSETVYQQAKVEYSSAASLIPALELRVKSLRNTLTMLMGEYPRDSFGRHDPMLDPNLDERIPTGIPSDLLKRRPDIRAAEQRLKAAMADVGVAYADRFPSFRIGFTPGFENDRLKDFLKSPYTYTIGQIVSPLVDFGRKKRKYKAAIAVYDQCRYDYEKAVITAFTEVNTSIIAYRRYRENHKVKTNLLEAAEKYVHLAWLQYRGGTLNYIEVLDAQRRYFDAQIGVNNALRDEYLAIINLYKALGGGWN